MHTITDNTELSRLKVELVDDELGSCATSVHVRAGHEAEEARVNLAASISHAALERLVLHKIHGM